MSTSAYSLVTWPKSSVAVFLPDHYAFTPQRGWHWLQRLCLWMLRKLKCNAVSEEIHWSQRRFDTREIGEAILRQHREVLAFIGTSDHDLCVLMGDEAFREVWRDADRSAPCGPMALNVSARIGRSAHGSPHYELYGFRVVVVPWIVGVHVVPARYFQ